MDELHLGANKLGVLINLLKDGAGFRTEDTIKKIAATIENIKIHIEKVIEVKERISQEWLKFIKVIHFSLGFTLKLGLIILTVNGLSVYRNCPNINCLQL